MRPSEPTLLRRNVVLVALLLTGLFYRPAVHAASTQGGHRTRNFPSFDNTPEGGWSVIEELNLAGTLSASNTTFDYGVPYEWDVGFSLLNGGLYNAENTATWNPDLLFNIERYFTLGGEATVVAGTALGTRPWDSQARHLENFTYLDAQWPLLHGQASLHAGIYYANAALAGSSDAVGFLVGGKAPLWRETLQLVGEFISGSNSLGMASGELIYKLWPHLQVGLGVQVATPATTPDYAAMVGVYWSHFDDPQNPVGH